jgi:hypothetical protein
MVIASTLGLEPNFSCVSTNPSKNEGFWNGYRELPNVSH